jgi:hypothetical protein
MIAKEGSVEKATRPVAPVAREAKLRRRETYGAGGAEIFSPAELESIADLIAAKVADRLASVAAYRGREEMARDLGVTVPTIDRWSKEGIIPAIKIKGRVVFEPTQVRDALRAKGSVA